MHSTNYTNTFIEVADDCKTEVGTVPPDKHAKTIARMQYEMIQEHPYHYTSDDVLFAIYTARNSIDEALRDDNKVAFFSKAQACLRASPLAKQYGWGIHFDSASKIALYARESEEYTRLKNDRALKHLKAMKSAK